MPIGGRGYAAANRQKLAPREQGWESLLLLVIERMEPPAGLEPETTRKPPFAGWCTRLETASFAQRSLENYRGENRGGWNNRSRKIAPTPPAAAPTSRTRSRSRYAIGRAALKAKKVTLNCVTAGAVSYPWIEGFDAEAQGLTVERWLERIAAQLAPSASIAHLQKTDPEEWARRFHQWAESHDRTTPLLSEQAIGRESIYPDRV